MASTTPFQGKVIAITGAGSGMGLELAHYLAVRGATLSLADIAQKSLDAASESVQKAAPDSKILATVVDICKSKEVDAWIASTVATFGKLDGAANMAAVIGKSIGVATLADLSDEEFDFIMSVNLKGAFYCLRAQMKAIVKGGSIVNTASIGGLVGLPYNGAYSASKHGVIGLTRSAAKEVGDSNIRINCICPGSIDTPMNRTASQIQNLEDVPSIFRRRGTAQEIAALIAYLLGNESTFTTGAAYSIDGGWFC